MGGNLSTAGAYGWMAPFMIIGRRLCNPGTGVSGPLVDVWTGEGSGASVATGAGAVAVWASAVARRPGTGVPVAAGTGTVAVCANVVARRPEMGVPVGPSPVTSRVAVEVVGEGGAVRPRTVARCPGAIGRTVGVSPRRARWLASPASRRSARKP